MKEHFNLKGELFELTILIEGNGKVQINTIIPEFEEGKWSGKYFSGIPINIIAIIEDNKEFKGWTGDLDSDEKNISLNLNKALTIKANF